ncbi:putative HNHc nuclease [Jeotgalibaca porci]|uniref:putative HNHc nuclease n=1 Tax=Jeotgalibaca porci TaxID=1868793 RepID=UPI0035A02F8D
MEVSGQIIKVSGREVTLSLDHDFDIAQASRISDGEMKVLGEVLDKRSITWPQQKLINALFLDASEYTGHPVQWWEDLLKTMFGSENGTGKVSIAANAMTQVQAGKFIEFILDFLLAEKIPFRFQEYHLAGDVSRILFLYIKHRVCFICGKPHSDYAHFETVGMGRNRKDIDHSQNRFMCLCRDHHTEQHKIGIKTFMRKYHLAPIKLKPEQIAEFGIGKNLHQKEVGK